MADPQPREDLKNKVLGHIMAAKQIMAEKGEKQSLETLTGKLNEDMDSLQQEHLDYMSKLDTAELKQDAQPFFDHVNAEVIKVREDITRYCNPEGIVHKAVSLVSTTASARQRAAAAKAKLVAERQMLDRKFDLDRAEQKIKEEKERLVLDTQIAQMDAEEKILAGEEELEDQEGVNTLLSSSSGEIIVDPNIVHSGPPPSPKCSSSNPQGELLKQQQQITEMIQLLQAPPGEITPFDGDPLKYYPFICAFNDSVEKKVLDSNTRLTCLQKYTVGKANAVILSCSLLPPEEGYSKAKEKLKARFGDKFTISHLWVQKITVDKPIKEESAHELEDLADDLNTCMTTLKALEFMEEISAQDTLAKIVRRLPERLQARWRSKVADIKVRKQRLPTIQDIIELIGLAVIEYSDPIYGKLTSHHNKPQPRPHGGSSRSSHNKQQASSFNVSSQGSQGSGA